MCLIHNIVFQGRFPSDPQAQERLGLSADLLAEIMTTQTLRVGRQKRKTKGLQRTDQDINNPTMPVVNLLLGAIKSSNMVLTVSPGYAREVRSDPIKGAEMQSFCAAADIQVCRLCRVRGSGRGLRVKSHGITGNACVRITKLVLVWCVMRTVTRSRRVEISRGARVAAVCCCSGKPVLQCVAAVVNRCCSVLQQW